MAGIGTSKEDKRRKRRSLPYEKKLQADALKLSRERQPTGRLLADVLKKSQADIKRKKVDKTVRGPHK